MKTTLCSKFKILICLMLFCAIIPMHLNAQNKLDKKQEKEVTKIAKKVSKDLEKQGWIVSGGINTLEGCLVEHHTKLKLNSDLQPVEGMVYKCRSSNACKQAAVMNAQTELAQTICAEIQGTTRQLTVTDVISAEESDKLVTAFGKNINTNLSGAFSRSFAIEKDNGDGTRAYRIYFLVDNKKINEATKAALQKSLDEVKLAKEISDEIFNIIEVEK